MPVRKIIRDPLHELTDSYRSDVVVTQQVEPSVEDSCEHIPAFRQLCLSYAMSKVDVAAYTGQKLVPYIHHLVVEREGALNLFPASIKAKTRGNLTDVIRLALPLVVLVPRKEGICQMSKPSMNATRRFSPSKQSYDLVRDARFHAKATIYIYILYISQGRLPLC